MNLTDVGDFKSPRRAPRSAPLSNKDVPMKAPESIHCSQSLGSRRERERASDGFTDGKGENERTSSAPSAFARVTPHADDRLQAEAKYGTDEPSHRVEPARRTSGSDENCNDLRFRYAKRGENRHGQGRFHSVHEFDCKEEEHKPQDHPETFRRRLI